MEKILFIKYNLNMDGVTSLFLNMNSFWKNVSIDYLIDEKQIPRNIECSLSKTGQIYSVQREFVKNHMQIPFLLFKLFYIYQLIRKNRYKIVHVHTEDVSRSIILLVAKLAGAKVRIMHSHNSASQSRKLSIKDKFVMSVLRRSLPLFVTHFFACSDEAAKWMFPSSIISTSKFRIIKNGILLEKYRFDPIVREKYRHKMGFSDKVIYCSVGRLERQKNYSFLLDIYACILRKNANSIFLFIGDGSEKESLERISINKGMERNVYFMGLRKDVPELLNMVDCFVLPSFFEGLPLVLVEAQTSGLPCFVSDKITKQVAITDSISYLSIDHPANVWAEKLQKISLSQRTDQYQKIKKAGFDMMDVAHELEIFYLSYQ